MSSRSNSPTPTGGSSSNTSQSASLSKDALYAPLSTLLDPSFSGTDGNGSRTHSLAALNVPAHLRESALIDFLADMGSSLKTSRRRETSLYRTLGGSLAARGAGDNDRAPQDAFRTRMRGLLSNRNLVLVGGGIHSHAEKEGSGVGDASSAAATNTIAGVAATTLWHKSRVKKRAVGLPEFGAVSAKRRKRVVSRNGRRRQEMSVSSSINKGIDSGGGEASVAVAKSAGRSGARTNEIITTLHDMWTRYTCQLLSPLMKSSSPKSSSPPTSTTLEYILKKRRISSIVATADHVGMSATIVKCSSRLHLISARCIVVEETQETWRVAMIRSVGGVPRPSSKKVAISADTDGKRDDHKKSVVCETTTKKKEKVHPATDWKMIVIPKRGTVLEVRLPPAVFGACAPGNTELVVRLET